MLSPGAPERAASDIGEWQIRRSSMRGLLESGWIIRILLGPTLGFVAGPAAIALYSRGAFLAVV